MVAAYNQVQPFQVSLPAAVVKWTLGKRTLFWEPAALTHGLTLGS
jgi:hypothetical protein